MTEPPTLRAPGPGDVQALAELHYRSWVATYGPLVAPSGAAVFRLGERVEHWGRLIGERSADRGACVAERAGRVVGLVEWEIGPEGDRSVGEVHAIHVAAGERGRGIGALLLAAGVAALRERGVSRAVLWVLEDNSAARRFYEHEGWTWDGTRVQRPLGAFPDFPRVTEVRYELQITGGQSRPGAGGQ